MRTEITVVGRLGLSDKRPWLPPAVPACPGRFLHPSGHGSSLVGALPPPRTTPERASADPSDCTPRPGSNAPARSRYPAPPLAAVAELPRASALSCTAACRN